MVIESDYGVKVQQRVLEINDKFKYAEDDMWISDVNKVLVSKRYVAIDYKLCLEFPGIGRKFPALDFVNYYLQFPEQNYTFPTKFGRHVSWCERYHCCCISKFDITTCS
jgi:hypothetical protein